MKATLAILAILALAGCRTAGPQVVLRDCTACHIHTHGHTDAAQGKTISPSAAASLAATLRDITAAQGDATGGDNTGDGGAEAAPPASTGSAPVLDPAAPAEETEQEPTPEAEPEPEEPAK